MAESKKATKFKSKYTPKEQQNYHNGLSKKGASRFNSATGEKYIISDFERGRHFEKAQQIHKARVKTYKQHHGVQNG